jgi:hypothetical protein
MWELYLICAVLGGTVMIIQFVLTLIGIGSDHDVGGDGHEPGFDVHHDLGGGHHGADHPHHDVAHGSSWFFGMLSLRAIVAALAFFGLAGLGGFQSGIEEPLRLLIAIAAGIAAMFLVGWVMQALARLRSEGTVRIDRAVGTTGTVYLTVPGAKSGAGKVTVNVQNRLMEFQAVTAQNQELPTGSKVVILSVVSPGTVEVAAAG